MKIYVDGGARGNPGTAAAAFVIYDGKKLVDWAAQELGVQTSNYAEYSAVIMALDTAANREIEKIEILSDSQLVVNQLNGDWKVKDETIKDIHQKVLNQLPHFKEVKFTHIPREQNQIADFLVNTQLI